MNEEDRKLRNEIIEKTIELDGKLRDLIGIKLGLEHNLIDNPITGEVELTNEDLNNAFDEYIWERLGASSKLGFFIFMAKRDKKEVPRNFENNFHELYKIRNQFAHRLNPKDKKGIRVESFNWESLHIRFIKLYEEIYSFIVNSYFVFPKSCQIQKFEND